MTHATQDYKQAFTEACDRTVETEIAGNAQATLALFLSDLDPTSLGDQCEGWRIFLAAIGHDPAALRLDQTASDLGQGPDIFRSAYRWAGARDARVFLIRTETPIKGWEESNYRHVLGAAVGFLVVENGYAPLEERKLLGAVMFSTHYEVFFNGGRVPMPEAWFDQVPARKTSRRWRVNCRVPQEANMAQLMVAWTRNWPETTGDVSHGEALFEVMKGDPLTELRG